MWRSSSASPAGCEPPTGSGGRSCCGCASTTRHGPRARTRCPSNTQTILAAARQLLAVAVPLIERQGITLVGISITNLDNGRGQLMLPLEESWSDALDASLDEVRLRFGPEAITRAVLLGRPGGVAMPLLPD